MRRLNRSPGRRLAPALLVIGLLAPICSVAMGAGGEWKIVGTQTLCFDDGRTVDRYLVRDLRTGEVFVRAAEEIPGLVESTFSIRAASARGGLTPWTPRRLPREIERLDFHLNSHADPFRAEFEEITYRLINPLRPVKKKKPRLRIEAEVIDPVYREGAMYREFMDDGVNMIYTHPQDQGMPSEYAGEAYGMATSYWDFETFTYRGGDVAFSAAALQGGPYERLVGRYIHEFGHIFGYHHTGWIEDFMSYVAPRARTHYYWDRTNFVWDVSWLKDKLVYGGSRQADGSYRAAVELLPPPESVIGMEFLRVDAPDANFGRHVLFLTTLKGYRDRPMTLTLYRGREVRPKRKIVRIRGYHPYFDDPRFAGLLENYDTSILYFTRQKDFEKLDRAVHRFGEPGEFYGVPYTHVLTVTAVIEGYRGPDDAEPATQTLTVRFAYRESGQFW